MTVKAYDDVLAQCKQSGPDYDVILYAQYALGNLFTKMATLMEAISHYDYAVTNQVAVLLISLRDEINRVISTKPGAYQEKDGTPWRTLERCKLALGVSLSYLRYIDV